MEQFNKGVSKDSEEYKYLMDKFPRESEDKIKKGIFVGPQLKELFHDPVFKLTNIEKTAWNAFENIRKNFSEVVRVQIMKMM